MTTVALGDLLDGGRWWLGHAARLLLFLGVLSLVALLVLTATGFRPLVVRSGSMAPAIGTGDVVITKLISPREASVGEVVTFRDPSRGSELVTHRVIRVNEKGAKLSFVTRGDANTGSERWSIDATGEMGEVVFRIPKVGYLSAWLGTPAMRIALMAAASILLGSALLRRIWIG